MVGRHANLATHEMAPYMGAIFFGRCCRFHQLTELAVNALQK